MNLCRPLVSLVLLLPDTLVSGEVGGAVELISVVDDLIFCVDGAAAAAAIEVAVIEVVVEEEEEVEEVEEVEDEVVAEVVDDDDDDDDDDEGATFGIGGESSSASLVKSITPDSAALFSNVSIRLACPTISMPSSFVVEEEDDDVDDVDDVDDDEEEEEGYDAVL